MSESLTELAKRHAPTLNAAIEAVETRKNWSPFRNSPSSKLHEPGKPEAGKAAFEAQLGKPFELDQPGIVGHIGAEVSPFTRQPLGITYPVSEPTALIAAAQAAIPVWRKTPADARIALCLEMAERIYDRNFEMAYSVMHVAGQSYTQAFSGSGPNALDRGIEALAYAAKAIAAVAPNARWERRFGKEDVALDKTYTLVPRGIGLTICCASFPTWNAYPAMFASLATGNPAIVKPHPIAILPMAIAVQECRRVLTDFGCDPNLVALAVDTPEEPIAQTFIDDPAVQIIDFTGSPRYGGHLENTITNKLLFTETAGINSVVLESCDDLAETAKALARATCLFSAQMCTSPQNIYVPRAGIRTEAGHVTFEEVALALIAAVNDIADSPAMSAGIMGAVQAEPSCDIVYRLKQQAEDHPTAEVLRRPAPYSHPDFPNARTMTPLIVALPADNAALYAQEHFGPVMFIIAAEDGHAAVEETTQLARKHGAISSYLYSIDEAFIDRSLDAYAEAGMNLSINLHGAMWANFAAAYSDYHVTGLNPAGNACLADIALSRTVFGLSNIAAHHCKKDRALPHDTKDFVGAWSLIDWRIEYADGGVTRPFGDNAHGHIVYAQNGIMTASIAKGSRENLGRANARNAQADQKAAAFDSYFHYAGPWRIDGEEVVHSVAMSLNPDMTGTDQPRLAEFDEQGGLTLSAFEPLEGEGSRHHILQWVRCS